MYLEKPVVARSSDGRHNGKTQDRGVKRRRGRGLNRVEWGDNISISIEHNDTPIPILNEKEETTSI